MGGHIDVLDALIGGWLWCIGRAGLSGEDHVPTHIKNDIA